MTNITFEKSVPADAEALTRTQSRAFDNDAVIYPGMDVDGPPGYNSLEETLKDIEKYIYYTIRADGQIVGGIIVFDRGDGHFHLDRIFIDPDHHNRGIGQQAMRFLHDTFAAKKWTLDTPIYAVRNHHFYEKMGYVKVGKKTEGETGLVLFSYERASDGHI
jgi:GNAT superfamily N-acetyltransferase